jgi:hypothetical protein
MTFSQEKDRGDKTAEDSKDFSYLRETLANLRMLRKSSYTEAASWRIEKKKLQDELARLCARKKTLERTATDLADDKFKSESELRGLVQKKRETYAQYSAVANSLKSAKLYLKGFIKAGLPLNVEERLKKVYDVVIPDPATLEKATLVEAFHSLWNCCEEELARGSSCAVLEENVEVEPGEEDWGYILNLGNVQLLFVNRRGTSAALWSYKTKKWQPLGESEYADSIIRAVEMLTRKRLPDIVQLPVNVEMLEVNK